VIGEGERDKAPMLFIGERVGNNIGPKVISRSTLWMAHLCAKTCQEQLRQWRWPKVALAERTDVYMQKIAIGPATTKAWWNWMLRLLTIFADLRRQKGCYPRRSQHSSWTGRGMTTSSRQCAYRGSGAPDQRWRCCRCYLYRRSDNTVWIFI